MPHDRNTPDAKRAQASERSQRQPERGFSIKSVAVTTTTAASRRDACRTRRARRARAPAGSRSRTSRLLFSSADKVGVIQASSPLRNAPHLRREEFCFDPPIAVLDNQGDGRLLLGGCASSPGVAGSAGGISPSTRMTSTEATVVGPEIRTCAACHALSGGRAECSVPTYECCMSAPPTWPAQHLLARLVGRSTRSRRLIPIVSAMAPRIPRAAATEAGPGLA
jgi:hypothetical protein